MEIYLNRKYHMHLPEKIQHELALDLLSRLALCDSQPPLSVKSHKPSSFNVQLICLFLVSSDCLEVSWYLCAHINKSFHLCPYSHCCYAFKSVWCPHDSQHTIIILITDWLLLKEAGALSLNILLCERHSEAWWEEQREEEPSPLSAGGVQRVQNCLL